jgi:hypothetical protein
MVGLGTVDFDLKVHELDSPLVGEPQIGGTRTYDFSALVQKFLPRTRSNTG